MSIGIRATCTLVALVVFLSPRFAASQQDAETATATSHGANPTMSEREKDGLHGPVEECTVETIHPPRNPNLSAWRAVTTTKYGPDGRVYQHGYTYDNGSKRVQYRTYDAEGRVLTEAWDGVGGPSETIYTYDVQGRLIGITGERGLNTTFEYDDQSRKTRIIKSEPTAPSAAHNRGGMGFSINEDDLYISPPPGGLVKTSFNERDQPVKSKAYAADGELISQFSHTYDTNGLVTESSLVTEKLAFLLSPEIREQFAADPEASEEMNREFLMFRKSYVYDDKGRVVEEDERRGPSQESITKITYNDHGDEMEAITATYDNRNH